MTGERKRWNQCARRNVRVCDGDGGGPVGNHPRCYNRRGLFPAKISPESNGPKWTLILFVRDVTTGLVVGFVFFFFWVGERKLFYFFVNCKYALKTFKTIKERELNNCVKKKNHFVVCLLRPARIMRSVYWADYVCPLNSHSSSLTLH